MGEIISFQEETSNFEMLVEEVEYLVPKYLESLKQLERSEGSELTLFLNKVEICWNRLEKVLGQIALWEDDFSYKSICLKCMQEELSTLEILFVPIHKKVCLADHEREKKAGQRILKRMDFLLEKMGFHDEHLDRRWAKETLQSYYG